MTSKTYLIDGYNLMFFLFSGEEKSIETRRNDLLCFLLTLGIKAHVVFDGAGDQLAIHTKKSLKIIYTPHHQKADHYITSFLEDHQSPTRFLVVSSDNEVMRRAKLFGAEVLSILLFLRHMEKKQAKNKNRRSADFEESEPNIQRYLKIFSKKHSDQ